MIFNLIYRVLICRNTAGVLDLENYVADSNKEMMKFEAQIGKSLWCVSSLSNISMFYGSFIFLFIKWNLKNFM